jgi:hypothetical protein
MMRFQRGLVGRLATVSSALALAGSAAGCNESAKANSEKPRVAVTRQAQLGDLAEQCGLDIDCELGGIAEGRANISGIAKVDAFFAAVINFQTKATAVSNGINAELEAIRGDFGIDADAEIGAEIQAQADVFVEGQLEVVAEPARCQVDARASVEASARCEGMVTPPMAMVECQGSCEVDASAEVDCGAEADLRCTVSAPSVACEGTCRGSCSVTGSAAANCSGTCNGMCNGQCSLENTEGQCAGKCEGTCMGSCEVELEAEASCEGTCSGECTVMNPEGGCEGGIRAHCEARGDAMVMCNGRCDGEVTPPMASAECQASAKAEASFNAECTPPRVGIHYELAVGGNIDAEAQARFEAAVKNLEVRLPRLLASIKGAEVMVSAATELSTAGRTAVEGAIEDFDASGNISAGIGLMCAGRELPKVAAAVEGGVDSLNDSVQASAELTAALGIE